MAISLSFEHVDGGVGVLGDEGGLEDRRRLVSERALRGRDPLFDRLVWPVDQHSARITAARDFPHLLALIEQVLEDLVGLQLDSVGFVDGPPEPTALAPAGAKLEGAVLRASVCPPGQRVCRLVTIPVDP